MLELPGPLAVVCHDAGASNHILAWLARENAACRPVMQGPAAALWAARFPGRPCVATLDEALDGAGALLSGTGWASDIEHQARVAARKSGVHSVAVVDHWVNYLPRFERHGQRELPDEIWVIDPFAWAEAQRCFPGHHLRLQPNVYLDEQTRSIAPLEHAGDDVLVVLEPVRNDWGRGIPGEFQALDFLVKHLNALDLPAGSSLRLRPHPSDAPGKYDEWLARPRAAAARLDDASSLAAAIGCCRVVAGCESYGLVVALAAGRRVVCMLPPWAPRSRLPHDDLIDLRNLAETP